MSGGFGNFNDLCRTAPLPLCASIGPVTSVAGGVGIEPDCYARNIELANTIIFAGAASTMHIIALVMTVIMVLHVRGKFTAVGTHTPAGLISPTSPTNPLQAVGKLRLSSTCTCCLHLYPSASTLA
jgi:hypothetical protein